MQNQNSFSPNPEIIQKYKNYLARTQPTNVIQRRASSLDRFMSWLEEKGHILTNPLTRTKIQNVTPQTIKQYKGYLDVSEKPIVQKRKVSAVEHFFDWLEKKGEVPVNPVKQIDQSPLLRVIAGPAIKPTFPFARIGLISAGAAATLTLAFLLTQAPLSQFSPSKSFAKIQDYLAEKGSALISNLPIGMAIPAPTSTPLPESTASPTPNDDVVNLGGDNQTIQALNGSLNFEAGSIDLKTTDLSNGDITISPDGGGQVVIDSEKAVGDTLVIKNKSLKTGTLISGIVGNTNSNYNFLEFTNGSSIGQVMRFSVDAKGNVYSSGDISASGDVKVDGNAQIGDTLDAKKVKVSTDIELLGNLKIGGVTRFNSLGRLASITGYYQDSGLFEIDQGAPDWASITKVLTRPGDIATNDVLTLSLDESALSTGSTRDTLVLSRKGAASTGYSLYVESGDALFNGNVTVRDNLTVNGTIISAPSTITLNCSDCIDFDDIVDSATLDASTSIGFGSSTFNLTFTNNGTGDEIHNLSSTGDLVIQDNGTAFVTFNDDSTITVAGRPTFTKVPSSAHTGTWATGSSTWNQSDATIYVNPTSATADSNLIGVAVGGSVKFDVDAEGDLYGRNMVLEGSVTEGTTTIAGDLSVEGNTTLGDASTDTVTLKAATLTTNNGLTFGGDGSGTDNLTVQNYTNINFNLKDNTADALDIQEGTNNYINISTSDATTSLTIDLPVAGSTSTTGNLFTANTTKTINLGTGTAADTINIGTGATNADTITIGSSASSTSIALTSGTGSQTFTSSVVTGTGATSAFVFVDNALTSGNGIDLSTTANGLTSGILLNVASTQTAATGTSVSRDITNFSFAPIYSTAITTPSVTGQVLDISRSVTTNSLFVSTLTLSGAVATFSDTATQTTGTLTSTADVVTITQNYTSNSGAALNITSAGASTAFALRVNDDGTLTDSTPFVVDNTGKVGIGTTSPVSRGSLHVLRSSGGGIVIEASAGNPLINFFDSAEATTLQNWDISVDGGDMSFRRLSDTYSSLLATPLILKSSGNVGIGDTSPDAAFEVLSTGEQLRLTNTDGTADVRMTLDSSGNLTFDADDDGTGSQTFTLNGFTTFTTALTSFACTDCIDFDDMEVTMDVDETTEVNFGASDLDLDLSSTGVLNIQDADTTYWTFDDDSTVDVLFPAAGTIGIDASTTANTTTAGVLNIDVTSNTPNNRAVSISTTWTNTGGGSNVPSYGLENTWVSTAVMGSVFGQSSYGIYNTATKTGADTASGTYTLYGSYNTASNTGRTDIGTVNTYAGYFSATGDANGITTVYGLRSQALGGDTGYGLYIDSVTATTDYGIYQSTAGDDNYFAGNVGIGTTAPEEKLHVIGNLKFGGATTANIDFEDSSNTNTNARIQYDQVVADAGQLFFSTKATGVALAQRMVITNTGNVGIGTTGPRVLLDLRSDAIIAAPTALASAVASGVFIIGDTVGSVFGLQLNGSSYDTYIQARNMGATSTAYNLLLQPLGGNVGIGTTAPSTTLHVQGSERITGTMTLGTTIYPGIQLRTEGTITTSGGLNRGINMGSTLASAASSDNMQMVLVDGVFSRGTGHTGLIARGLEIAPSFSGTGTASQYAGIIMTEQTAATANIGLLIGAHPGGSTNYSIYNNSANNVYLGTGSVGIGTTAPGYNLETVGPIASTNSLVLNTRTNMMTSGVYYGTSASGWSAEGSGATIASVTTPANGFHGAFLRIQSDGTFNSDRMYASGGAQNTQFSAGTTYRISFRYRATSTFTIDNRDFIISTLAANTGNAIFYTTTYTAAGGDCAGSCWFLVGLMSANNTVEIENLLIEDTTNLPTNRFFADALGNVGIGTTNPQRLLHLKGDNGYVRYENGARTWELGGNTSGNFELIDVTASNAKPLTILGNNGNVGIGTTNPGTAFSVSTNIAGLGPSINNLQTGDSANYTTLRVATGAVASAGSFKLMRFMAAATTDTDGTEVGSVQMNINAVAYNTTSDRRLKENIEDSTKGLDTLMKLQVRDYNFISDPNKTTKQGFIAQELYELYPEAVSVGEDDVTKNPWQVDYSRLTPLLAKAVQELNNKVSSFAFNDSGNLTIDGQSPNYEVKNSENVITKIGGVKVTSPTIESEDLNSTRISAGDIRVTRDAVVSRKLSTSQLAVSGDIVAKKIYADEIITNTLSANFLKQGDLLNIEEKMAELESRLQTTDYSPQPAVDSSQSTVDNSSKMSVQDIEDLKNKVTTLQAKVDSNTVTAEVLSQFLGSLKEATADDSTNLTASSVVTQNLFVGSLMLYEDSISTIGTLYLQNNPFAQLLDIFNGAVRIDKEGKITAGEVVAQKVETKELIVKGLGGENVVSITASGGAQFSDVKAGTAQLASVVIDDSSDTPSAGTGTLPAGTVGIVIKMPEISDKSLIYITPTSLTQDKILYVKNKVPGKEFTVGIDAPVSTPITFNYWVIEKK